MASFLLTFLIASFIHVSPSEFICNNVQCECEQNECSQTCIAEECNQKYFVCPSSTTLCTITCNGQETCNQIKEYSSADNTQLNCDGTSACDDAKLFCGKPDILPVELQYWGNDLSSAQITECTVNLMKPNSMSNGHIECNGNVQSCTVNALNDHSLSQSSFLWYVPCIHPCTNNKHDNILKIT